MSTTVGDTRSTTGTNRLSAGLWIALAAAMVQFTAVGSDFYIVNDSVRDAWFGIPHAAELVALSALTTVVLAALSAADRSPVRGRTAGLLVGGMGLLATAQIAYRMAVPPFGGCLTYSCGANPNPNPEVALLAGIWIAVIASAVAMVGGFLHAASSRAAATRPNFWVSDRQTGATPALTTAAVAAVAMFVVGFTWLDFYTVPQGDSTKDWSAWLAAPHTATLVLLLVLGIAVLAYAASRHRAPLDPEGTGAVVALLAFAATARTAYRMAVSPFYSGPAEGVFGEGVVINAPAYVAVGLGAVAIVAGLVHMRSEGTSHTVADDAVTTG